MIDLNVVTTLATTGLQIAAVWTGLSVVAASAWCVYRAPGRSERLLLDDGASLMTVARSPERQARAA